MKEKESIKDEKEFNFVKDEAFWRILLNKLISPKCRLYLRQIFQ